MRVRDGRIAAVDRACDLGRTWFGDGRVPARALVAGREASRDAALEAAAAALAAAERPLVYLAPDLTCEAQRAAVELADLLRACLDSPTSGTVLRTILAAQEQGRAGATLGEIRNRADLLVCWGVDPMARYPRFWSRYAPEPAGLHVPEGRRSRTVIAVDVGASPGPADADVRYAVAPEAEVDVLTELAAAVSRPSAALTVRDGAPGPGGAPALLARLLAARYAAIVADAEPDAHEDRDPYRADALIALAHALNGPTRCALSALRGGGNRSGADAVLTWQTGFPMAVDFARGTPRYRPHDGRADVCLDDGVDVVLVVGAAGGVPAGLAARMARVRAITVGPRASDGPLAGDVAIDTGVAGIHESGTAVRMDDVPVPLRPSMSGPPSTEVIVRAVTERIVASQGFRS